jgi:cytosine deaminase
MKSAKFLHHKQMLNVAIQEARKGLDEGGIPIGAALFHTDGTLLGKGRKRSKQAYPEK